MLMKAGCSNNQCYVDRFTSSFVRVIQRLAREHNGTSNVETIGMSFIFFLCSHKPVKFYGLQYSIIIFVCFVVRRNRIANVLLGRVEKSCECNEN